LLLSHHKVDKWPQERMMTLDGWTQAYPWLGKPKNPVALSELEGRLQEVQRSQENRGSLQDPCT
jgi:hypothetical protein